MGWISVKEDKPNNLEAVNVTFVNHCPPPYYARIKDKPIIGTCVYFDGEWFWYSSKTMDSLAEYGRCDPEKLDSAIEITHWMPLPKSTKKIKKMIEYKGYYADYYFAPRDCMFYGTLYGIKDKVDFQCHKEDKIEKEFHKAVDDYLNFCEEIGKEPEKPKTRR